MGTVLFWIVWGIISFWALKTFYYSFSKEKLEHLRKANIGFTFAVLILYFLPWVPLSMDGWTGFGLALQGNFLAALFFIFLLISLVLLFQKEYIFLKIASVLMVLLTLDLFALMLVVRPGTFTLSLYDIAPIIAALILLVADVSLLLLWQQMNLTLKAAIVPGNRKKLFIGSASFLIISFGLAVWGLGIYINSTLIHEKIYENNEETKERKEMQVFEAFAKNEPGTVCVGNDTFSFQIDTSYNILSDDDSSVAMIMDNNLVTVSKSKKSVSDILKENGVKYTKEEDYYIFDMPQKNSTSGNLTKTGISLQKGEFIVSVFYSEGKAVRAKEILSGVSDSLKEGCNKQ
ncbi:hypothetical protein A2773_04880 [Candidatus Gottesmanbacteria bacterium RIFCSPHIGHO2_01_FULL_39_10]|uniref:Uncharacterized protein n=1 Tax=Candidatus Gottesmanbacteria bacterium RIFCSPHIGHO2_01_FULL_39_10 TaxID=1798375 RepID=A0A1F5ZRZ6_9BACT|nr:MAG: hypothetical protein A2773_04880 [Candidatus Gottesmanbacteria bacterium RIFCSPHIGHO2_01_FULL_39_10]